MIECACFVPVPCAAPVPCTCPAMLSFQTRFHTAAPPFPVHRPVTAPWCAEPQAALVPAVCVCCCSIHHRHAPPPHLGCVGCGSVGVSTACSRLRGQLPFFVRACHGSCLLCIRGSLQGGLKLLLLAGLGMQCLFEAGNVMFLVLYQIFVEQQHSLNVTNRRAMRRCVGWRRQVIPIHQSHRILVVAIRTLRLPSMHAVELAYARHESTMPSS